MAETLFAVITDGEVKNIIVAEQRFVDALPDDLTDPDVDTGQFESDDTLIKISGMNPMPGLGWTVKNKKFSPPVVTQEELDAQAALATQVAERADDDAFLAAVTTKLRKKQAVTADEKTRLQAIDVSRR